ncbi:MAG: putative addiction module antidote protein [Armatimonadetes bacterium]|nr:putative addiction module antidote protein [Armatimonadota bacterium]
MRLVAFDETLYRELQDDGFATAYLQDALDDNLEEFMIALGKCVRARGGMTKCARDTGLSREALYRMFEPGANPTMQSMERILRAAGLRLCLGPDIPAEERGQAVGIPRFLYERLEQQAQRQGVDADTLVQSLLGVAVAQMDAGHSVSPASPAGIGHLA